MGNYLPLFDRQSVVEAAIARHGSESAVRKFAADMDPDLLQTYKSNVEERERRHDEARFHKQRADKIRHRAYTRKPIAEKEVESGTHREPEREKVDGVSSKPDGDDTDRQSSSPDEAEDIWSDLEPERPPLRKALAKAKIARDFYVKDWDWYADRKLSDPGDLLCGNPQRITSSTGAPDDLSLENKPCLPAVLRVPWLNM
jgi:hypothetical protein